MYLYETRAQSSHHNTYLPVSNGIHPYRPGIDDDTQQQLNYWTSGYEPIKEDQELTKSGLRGRKLIIVVGILCLLWLIAIATLLCNILLLGTLGIHTQGMKTMQFHRIYNERTGHTDHIVQFTGRSVELENVIAREGQIKGTDSKDLYLAGARVILQTDPKIDEDLRIKTTTVQPLDMKDIVPIAQQTTPVQIPYLAPTKFILEDNRIRVDSAHDFQVMEFITPTKVAEMFSALTPKFIPDKRIKQVSTSTIITNKIRSPLNDSLHIDVENVAFRGNEGNVFASQRFKLQARNDILFYTPSADGQSQAGALKLNSTHGVYLPSSIEVSSAPSLMANREAYVLCACKSTNKLFLAKGILKQCRIDPALCY